MRLARHSPDNAYARGIQTKARVIEAAIDVFGKRGFEHASTREIAQKAGVQNAAIHYYFGGKGDLYHACMDRVTTTIAMRIDKICAKIDPVVAKAASKSDLIDTYCDMFGSLLDSFFTKDEGVSVNMLFFGDDSVAEVQAARNLMRDRIELPMYRRMVAIVSKIIDRRPEELETGLNTFALSGLTMVFYLDQRRISNAIGWHAPTPPDLAMLKGLIRRQLTLLLNALYEEAHGSRGNAAASRPSRK